VDDTTAIHEDFRKILIGDKTSDALDKARGHLFGEQTTNPGAFPSYVIDSAYQGQEALLMVKQAHADKKPYSLLFVDMRMPPGWDGITTIQKIWEVDPEIQVVICSAHSDYSWEEIFTQLKETDNLLVLKKPFDVTEIRQLASALTTKWTLKQAVQYQINNLETLIRERTIELDESLSLLRATMESTEEGILVLDEHENILLHNQKLLSLWDCSETLLRSAPNPLQEVAAKFKNPSYFLTMINNIFKNTHQKIVNEWHLHSGTILEIYAHPRVLNGSTKGVVLSMRDITERKALEEELFHQTTHDVLTGLPNRALLVDRLEQAIDFARENHLIIGVFMLDLDNFKYINDSLGHQMGDQLLTAIAKKITHTFRKNDTVARFGGDEFALFMVRAHKEEIIAKAKKLLALFLEPFDLGGHHLSIATSIGISIYPKDGNTALQLLKNADSALYYAKNHGKRNFELYVSEFNDNLNKKIELKAALEQALQKKQFELHYQPLLQLETQKIIGLEALLRWNYPGLGIIHPCQFIRAAEESGLIISIGNWVFKTACLQIKKWQKAINPDLNMAINVSGLQIMQTNFVETIITIIEETGVNPQSIELEITESIILENSSYIIDTMNQLRTLGIKLSMDDFGVGYSSLNYVKYFPFDKIKIDKSFIEGINLNVDDRNIVEAIIHMTRSMGLQVLAEGVETKEQIDFLTAHHSNQIQGFYISPPLNKKDCELFLKKTMHK
jgi:diguanylate cyclase (GGDEF)-like protein/PAS domain S-box-containing protein